MNKLVSRNPILRFYLGKKIVKAADGLKADQYYYFDTNTNKIGIQSGALSTYKKRLTSRYNYTKKGGKKGQMGSFDGGKTYYDLNTGHLIQNAPSFMSSRKKQQLGKNVSVGLVITYANNFFKKADDYYAKKKKKATSTVTKAPVQELPKTVLLPETTTTTQLTTTTYTPPTLNFNPNNLPIFSAPKTPDFGYKTTNDYTSSDFKNKLSGLGINNNTNFVRFLNETGGDTWTLQFRNDARYALGADYSDENIRKVFNTQGNWGRGFLGRGDYGDLLNALAGYAKEWNDAYNRKSQEYDLANKYFKTPTFLLYNPTTIPLFSQSSYLPLISKWWAPALSLTHYMKKGGLISKSPIERFRNKINHKL